MAFPTGKSADWIAARRLAGQTVADMPTTLKPKTEDDAYRVQFAVLDRLIEAGRGPRIGWKVGVTTPQMKALLKIDHSIGGGILTAGRVASGGRVALSDFARLGIECEVAAVMAKPLGGAGSGTVDRRRVADAVGTLHPAIELVDDRYGGDYVAFGVPTIVADSSFHAGLVLGRPVANWRDLDLEGNLGTTSADGEEKCRGHGRDVLGHPFESIAWLADRLSAFGRRIEAGDIVMTGSLPIPYWVDRPGRIETRIEGLGSVKIEVT